MKLISQTQQAAVRLRIEVMAALITSSLMVTILYAIAHPGGYHVIQNVVGI